MILDTCTLLWLVADQKHLPAKVFDALRLNVGSLFISSISAFEIALKHRKHRLTLPMAPDEWIASALLTHNLKEIPVDSGIAVQSALLPSHHGDPADRIIIATALLHSLTILTPDPLFRKYKVKTLW